MKKIRKPDTFNFLMWQLVHRTFRVLSKVRQKELDPIGVTIGQSAILRGVLYLRENATIKEISKYMGLEINSISGQLKRMESEGFITKKKKLSKKGLMSIEITQQGYSLYLQTMNQQSFDDIFNILSEKEKLQLWSLLSRIRNESLKKMQPNEIDDVFPPSDPANIIYY